MCGQTTTTVVDFVVGWGYAAHLHGAILPVATIVATGRSMDLRRECDRIMGRIRAD